METVESGREFRKSERIVAENKKTGSKPVWYNEIEQILLSVLFGPMANNFYRKTKC